MCIYYIYIYINNYIINNNNINYCRFYFYSITNDKIRFRRVVAFLVLRLLTLLPSEFQRRGDKTNFFFIKNLVFQQQPFQ